MNKFKPKCSVPACTNLSEKMKEIDGYVYYRKYCSRHKREKYGMRKAYRCSPAYKFREAGKANVCVRCGWIGPCDIHRIVPGWKGGRYVEGNMESICPNCHRLQHMLENKLQSWNPKT